MSMRLGNGANQIVGGYFEKMDKQNDFEDYLGTGIDPALDHKLR